MKKIHIVILVFIAILVGVLISMLGNFSRYETFESAYAKKGKEINVVGVLNKDKGVEYNPEANPNLFSMYVTDSKGLEKKVVVHKAKPRDIEKSEKVVVIGKMNGDTFEANDILMKCPSKYKNQEKDANGGRNI